jgi:hypothetical protein
MGLNKSLSKNGVEYHIQTEDLVLKAKIRTQVFVDGGRVLHTDYYSYSDHLNSTDLTARLIKVMRACHQKIIMMIEQGTLTIEALQVNVKPESPELLVKKPSDAPVRNPSGIRPKTQSELWDSMVKEARRRNNRRVMSSSRPPCCWDKVVQDLKKLG